LQPPIPPIYGASLSRHLAQRGLGLPPKGMGSTARVSLPASLLTYILIGEGMRSVLRGGFFPRFFPVCFPVSPFLNSGSRFCILYVRRLLSSASRFCIELRGDSLQLPRPIAPRRAPAAERTGLAFVACLPVPGLSHRCIADSGAGIFRSRAPASGVRVTFILSFWQCT